MRIKGTSTATKASKVRQKAWLKKNKNKNKKKKTRPSQEETERSESLSTMRSEEPKATILAEEIDEQATVSDKKEESERGRI